MTQASALFYKEFIETDQTLETLSERKNIKCSTGCKYIAINYNSDDAERIRQKLGLDRDTIARAFAVMVETQTYRKQHPGIKSEMMTYYIHKTLGSKCKNCCLATSIIRKLYQDLCNKHKQRETNT